MALDTITWSVIVPLAFASLLSGIISSLGSRWGLFRHYWVLAKLALTAAATVVLMLNTGTMAHLAAIASDPSRQDFDALGGQLLHSGAGLLVLAAVTLLAVYKPRGLTPYGWKKQQKNSAPDPA